MLGTEDPESRRLGSAILKQEMNASVPRGGTTHDRGNASAEGVKVGAAPRIDSLIDVTSAIRERLDCQAVGIRLIDEDGNATFCVQDGFARGFSAHNQPVSLFRDRCVSAQVLSGEFDADIPFFTSNGSFVAGSASECSTPSGPSVLEDSDLLGGVSGYQSVMLSRIRCMELNLGLIHCADPRPHRFTSLSVSTVEGFADVIGCSLFFDSLWTQTIWPSELPTDSMRAVCSVCARLRDSRGHWVEERRVQPRIRWSVLRNPRVVCPQCLQFCNAD